MARDLAALAERLQDYLNSPVTSNLIRQAHARKMMVELGSNRAEWPQFNDQLDELLHYGANNLLSGGLDLLGNDEFSNQAKSFLFHGAESLEFLASSPETYRGSIPDSKLKSAAAYYLSGHHARAFVILDRDIRDLGDLGILEQIVALMLKQDISATHYAAVGILAQELYTDRAIAASIDLNELEIDDAISRIAIHSVARSVMAYLEFLRSGIETHLEEAKARVDNVISLAREARLVDVWWWSKIIEKLFDELNQTSLWTNLRPLMPDGGDNSIVRAYIIAAMQRNICTLWPSQLTALRKIVEIERQSFCVRMPTSSGKTRIAELAILTAFRDFEGQSPTCIYIAPFRSLAVEVESSLRAAFDPLGFSVSELYGGFELSEAENAVIDSVNIVVVTPEKLDAMLRFAPQIFENVKCVVVDEGHTAGDTSERGLRAEFMLNRLLRRLPRDTCRYVFASAVLPNAEDFATWIGGNGHSLVSSDWRPSRQMIGELRWRAAMPARIVYTHAGHERFETDCFIPRFIERTNGHGRRRRSYPEDPREAIALSAIRLATQGAVLLFVPQRQHVEATGSAVLDAITLEQLHNPDRPLDHMSAPAEAPEVADCLAAIDKELGPNSVLSQCVRKGIAVHHGRLPWQIRQPMEKFIASGNAQVIVATTTLSAGINLPIRTVLVKGLWQGPDKQVDSLTFWNICGRAGRGMKEIEGQILFFMDLDRAQWRIRRDRKYNQDLIERPNTYSIMGVLYLILRALQRQWLERIPEVGFETICEKLANNDFNWLANDEAQAMKAWFRLLDDQLFALASERLEDGELADTLESVLSDSLLSVQLASSPIESIDLQAASKAISARLDFVRKRVPERTQRDRFYKLGLPLDDCLQLHNSLTELRELMTLLNNWSELDIKSRSEWTREFVSWAVKLPFAQVLEEQVDGLKNLVVGFMNGASLTELSQDLLIAEHWQSPQEVGAEIESFCVFRLSWIANAVSSYLQATTDEDATIASITSALPAMFKYGTMEPLATVFAPFLGNSRELAEQIAAVCPFVYGDNAVYAWFRGLTAEALIQQNLDPMCIERIIAARNRIVSPIEVALPQPHYECVLEVISREGPPVVEVIVSAVYKVNEVDGPYIDLLQPDGTLIGHYRPIGHPIVDDWFNWVRTTLRLSDFGGYSTLTWSNVS